jgi:hypothetical protein
MQAKGAYMRANGAYMLSKMPMITKRTHNTHRRDDLRQLVTGDRVKFVTEAWYNVEDSIVKVKMASHNVFSPILDYISMISTRKPFNTKLQVISGFPSTVVLKTSMEGNKW